MCLSSMCNNKQITACRKAIVAQNDRGIFTTPKARGLTYIHYLFYCLSLAQNSGIEKIFAFYERTLVTVFVVEAGVCCD